MGDADIGSTTSEVLLAAYTFIGVSCKAQNVAFLECKKADRNPEACLGPGEAVATCVQGVIKALDSKTHREFANYQRCLLANDNRPQKCRETESALKAAFQK